MDVHGKRVLVTGATGGLGGAIARRLGRAGARLTLTGRRTEDIASLAADLDAEVVKADLGDPAQFDRLIAEAADVDVLIANAGLPTTGRLASFTTAEIDRALAVNLRAPIVMAHALVPGMLERGQGHIVFISSMSGKVGAAGSSIYAATKYGLRGFSLALRADLHGTGVGISTIFPTFIRDAGMFAQANVKLPPGVGTKSPEDVANAVLRSIEHNRAEIDVAPMHLRAGVAFAVLAPETSARLTRMAGGDRVALALEAKQKHRRN